MLILPLSASSFLFAVSLRFLFFLGVSWWRVERESKVHSFHGAIGSCSFSYYSFGTCPILLLKMGWGGRAQMKGKSALCVYCRERDETSLRGRRDYPKDLTAGKSARANRYSTSTPRGQRTQRETSQRSRQKTILNSITYLHPCCPTASLVGLYLRRS